MSLLKKLKVSRRFALRGALGGIGVAMWLPVLDVMCNNNGTAFAAGDPLPTSFGIWFWGNGIHTDSWTPTTTGSGDAWQLSKNLQSFAGVKSAMTLVTGLDMMDAQFKGHGWGVAYVLAGGDGTLCTLTSDLGSKVPSSHHFETSDATQYQPTVDQTIADAIHKNEPFKSFETGMIPFSGDVAMGTPGSNLAHRGPNDFLPPKRDPTLIFNTLFGANQVTPPAGGAGGGGTGGAGGAATGVPSDISFRMRRSVLDAVLQDAARLKMTLGVDDARRIDSHMDGIRSLEMQIPAVGGAMGTAGAGTSTGGSSGGSSTTTTACKTPAAPPMTLADMTAKSKAINGLIVNMLSCNLTRVYTHLWSGPRSDSTYPVISIPGAHHAYTHGTDAAEPRAIELYIMQQYADLATQMQATPMGAGTVLDNTVCYGISEVAEPKNHIMTNYHVVLMGHAGGKLPGNRHIRIPGRKVTELVLTLQQVMGLNVTSWGSWDKTSKVMSEILA
ncbi:MAG TPA: DUF1552 domain-containing protein [Polyangiaceae bacterium]